MQGVSVRQVGRTIIAALTLAFSAPVFAQSVAPSDALATMRAGNSLQRMGLYRSALLRYREAADAGLDTPLLHYNIAVAEYRLREYDEAIADFTLAYADPALAELAAYNLGLSHRAAKHDEEARRWLDRVRAQGTNTDLRNLAERALQALAPVRMPVSPLAREPERPGEFRLRLSAAYGTDDNPNRSPTDPYVDVSLDDEPLVVPDRIETSYMPVSVDAEYVLHNEPGDTDFVFGYELDGDYYGEYYANDEVTQHFRIGADVDLSDDRGHTRRISSSVFATHHYQRDFDLEDGVDRVIEDYYEIYRRFCYLGVGLETDFSQTLGRWLWGFDLRLEHRDFDEVPIVADFDDDIYVLKARVEYAVNPATNVYLGLQSYRRAFVRLPSRDLDGTLLGTNPPLEYAYSAAELGMERRLGQRFRLEASLRLIERTDEYVGYESYTQEAVDLRASYRARENLRISLGINTRSYDYPNAFAFNNPVAGPREREDSVADFSAEYDLNRRWSIVASVSVTDVTSTDTRAAYTRLRSTLGAVWSL